MVNNRTQAVVADDLGIPAYAAFANPKTDLKTKDRADLLEAYLGALYIDKDMEYCRKFAEVCFFPRLNQFIVNQVCTQRARVVSGRLRLDCFER